MATYFPTSNNERDNSTMLYLRDSHSQFPSSNMIMYTNSSYSDSNTLQNEVLLNFGGSRDDGSTWKDDTSEMIMMQHEEGNNSVNLQGLSLSLGTNVQSVLQYNQDFSSVLSENGGLINNSQDRGRSEDGFRNKQSGDNDYYMISGFPLGNVDAANPAYVSMARAIPNSRYLKSTQELLDEVVNVKKAINANKELIIQGELGEGASDSCATKASLADKQELQDKMTKLLSMLDEVDRRYRQYYHQMQIVVSYFDTIAGSGAAKPYTSVALETISRQFRCMRDAINRHIHAARKSLGEEDAYSNDKGVGISRLRYVDQHRALQQHHAWRPQRGLPETSVSVLRAWLFEHFLHPYPKDSDKIMLARQTGLTRSQVSNWFINARVRLWKPMVEEMYKEETGEADVDSISSSERTAKASDDKTEHLQSKSDQMIGGPDTNSIFQSDYGIGKTKEMNDSSNPFCARERFITAGYDFSEMERFGNVGGGVSLTLGLQQCEDAANHGFVPLREIDVYNDASASGMATDAAEFECLDSGNRSARFVSSLLPSFT